MLYKMKAGHGFVGNCTEHTYAETVFVKNGIAVCKTRTARDTLYSRGYDPLEEIPVDVGDSRIDDKYYTIRSFSAMVEDDTVDLRPASQVKKEANDNNKQPVRQDSNNKKTQSRR